MKVRFIRRTAIGLITIGLALATGCATTYTRQTEASDRVGGAVQQPLRDLSLMRESTPEILRRAAAAPYATPADCPALLEEIAGLDLVLGPDVDQRREDDGDALDIDPAGVAAGAIGDVLGLPYRGLVRRVSGAERRDAALRRAILAGMVRRAYLKGVMAAGDCAAQPS